MANDDRPFDPSRKFARLTKLRDDGFVEFDFAIGEPEIFVEMILPQPAFDEFCRINEVIVLEGAREERTAESDWAWRMRDAMARRFR